MIAHPKPTSNGWWVEKVWTAGLSRQPIQQRLQRIHRLPVALPRVLSLGHRRAFWQWLLDGWT